MENQMTFKQARQRYLKTLEQYVPVVERVHGAHHPEFLAVRKVFDAIVRKTKDAVGTEPDLDEEFARLREITDSYRVPQDVCESYEAVYHMLGELDAAYRA